MKGLIRTGLVLFMLAGVQCSWAQKETHVDPLDYAPDEPDSVLIDRIASLDFEIPVVFNSKVRSFIDYFTIRKRDYLRLMLKREQAYFPLFEEALARHELPNNLKYLTIVESGMNPRARSRVGAMGLWQFMPSTGKMFGLKQDYYVDERMDPFKATDAACAYLKRLHEMFDDWELALAAYNCGPGNVRRAIRKSGYKETFWEIYDYLPRETRSYVPQFMAVNYAMNYADEHNLFVDRYEVLPKFDTLRVTQYFNVNQFLKYTPACKEDMLKLNPEILRDVVPEKADGYVLRIPSYVTPYFQENQVAILDSAKKKGAEKLNVPVRHATGTTTEGKRKIVYTVRSGDVLGAIASRYHVKLSDLRRWNGIGSNNMIRIGQKLVIYKDPSYFKATPPAQKAKTQVAVAKDLNTGTVYTVQPGDTLWSISKKYKGLTIESIKTLNNLTSDRLTPGQKLKLG